MAYWMIWQRNKQVQKVAGNREYFTAEKYLIWFEGLIWMKYRKNLLNLTLPFIIRKPVSCYELQLLCSVSPPPPLFKSPWITRTMYSPPPCLKALNYKDYVYCIAPPHVLKPLNYKDYVRPRPSGRNIRHYAHPLNYTNIILDAVNIQIYWVVHLFTGVSSQEFEAFRPSLPGGIFN